jgi:hypothetical protein
MRLLSSLWIVVLCAGCGEGLPIAPVSGTITLDGNPLAGATITTQPIAVEGNVAGSGSFGTTDAEGRYELELVKPAVKGAIVGEHRVMISQKSDYKSGTVTAKLDDGTEFKTDDPNAHRAGLAAARKWPSRYTDGSLQLTVPPEGTSTANFDLTKDGR